MSGVDSHHRRGLNAPRLYDLLLFAMTRGRERRYRELLLDLARIGAGDTVLDVGCGTGTLAIAAWERSRPCGSVCGVDVSANMIAAARRKSRSLAHNASLSFSEAGATALPFDAGTFDVVTVITMLHMLAESERLPAIEEALRVLRPGGRLLLVDYGGEQRKGLVSRHHLHRAFDLGSLKPSLRAMSLIEFDEGPLGWFSLHFLLATRSSEQMPARNDEGR